MVFRQHRTDFICEAFDVRMIMHPPRMTIPLLQVLLGFSIAVQRPLCTVQGGEVRMDITPEERCDRGTPVPATVRMTAVICSPIFAAGNSLTMDRVRGTRRPLGDYATTE